MKVALINNPEVECGNAEYGRDLAKELAKEFELSVYPKTESTLADEQVVLINWHPARINVNEMLVANLKQGGRKVILIHQNYAGGPVPDFGNDATVCHEEYMGENPPAVFRLIQHGIPEVDNLPEPQPRMLGIAGFPFPWKGYEAIAVACKDFNAKCRMIAPKSDQMNTDGYISGLVKYLGPLADAYHGWMPKEEVVRMLAECTANVFFFWGPGDDLGQSGSIRMGVAAKRPLVTSTGRRVKTLFKYDDEIYFCQTQDAMYQAVAEILQHPEKAKKPKRVVKELGWSKMGEQYRTLIKELAA